MNSKNTVTAAVAGEESLVALFLRAVKNFAPVVRSQPVAFEAVGEHEAADFKVFVAEDVSVGQLAAILQQQTEGSYSYVLHILPSCGSRKTPESVVRAACANRSAVCRELRREDFAGDALLDDLLSACHLATATESAEEKRAIVHRYVQATARQDEIAQLVAKEGFFKKTALEPTHVNKLFSVGFLNPVLTGGQLAQLRRLTRDQNLLWMRLAWDADFLIDALSSLEAADDFMRRSLALARKVRSSPFARTAKLCYSRNDAFLDRAGQFKQVEPNMWGVGFGPMLDRLKRGLADVGAMLGDARPGIRPVSSLPQSEACLVAGLEAAWRHYGRSEAIVVLVSTAHVNGFDMFAAAAKLAEAGIPMLRYSFAELGDLLEVDEQGRASVLGREVAAFYFRDGYTPDFYDEQAWTVRERIELSAAVKAPDVMNQLTNCKLAQHLMGQRATWERYGFDEATITEQLAFCTESHCPSELGTPADVRAFVDLNGGSDAWIAKPQRDGGGHCLSGAGLDQLLATADSTELSGFVLQRKIDRVIRTSVITDWKKTVVCDVDDELGLFYCVLSQDNQVLAEFEGGEDNWSKKSSVLEEDNNDSIYGVFSGIDVVGA